MCVAGGVALGLWVSHASGGSEIEIILQNWQSMVLHFVMWVLKQFNSPNSRQNGEQLPANSHGPLNTAVDNHLAENNLSLQQIVQEHEDGVEFSTSLGPVVELCMKLASLEAIFGPEILGGGTMAAELDILSWMNVSSNNLFNMFKNQW